MYCQLLQDSTLLSLGCETTFWQLAGDPAFRNIGLLAVAVIGIGFAIYRSVKLHQQTKTAIRQADTSEAGLNIDRFQKGVEMLSSNNRTMREAGVHLLSELAIQNLATYYIATRTALTGFITQLSDEHLNKFNDVHGKQLVAISESEFVMCCGENELALQQLSELKSFAETRSKRSNERTNFSGANFCLVYLENGNFKNMVITNVNFNSSHLINADFRGVVFNRVCFLDTDLCGAKFGNNKGLTYAQLSKAKNVDPEFLAKLKADEDAAAAKATEEISPT